MHSTVEILEFHSDVQYGQNACYFLNIEFEQKADFSVSISLGETFDTHTNQFLSKHFFFHPLKRFYIFKLRLSVKDLKTPKELPRKLFQREIVETDD